MYELLRKWVRRHRRLRLEAGRVRLHKRTLSDHILPSYLVYILNKYGIDCVIDVGANHGQFAIFLRGQIDYRGPILSFEPGPETYQRLQSVIARETGIETRQCAIGAEPGTLTLNVMEKDVLNSFYTPRQSDVDISHNRVVRTEEVEVCRLDALADEMPRLASAQRILLKTDTQGFDLQVIAGAEGLLPRVVGVLMEVPFSRIYEEAPTYHEVIETMAERGFHLAACAPSGVYGDRVVDLDMLFLNAAFAGNEDPQKDA